MSDFVGHEVLNLENCAREPIHVPGSIQPHGVLFVLRYPDLTIAQVSENVLEFLGRAADEFVEQPLSRLLTPLQLERIRSALDTVDPAENNPVELQMPTLNGAGNLDGFIHRHENLSILELEPSAPAETIRFLEFYKTVSKLTAQMQNAIRLDQLLAASTDGIRKISGFDRVMIYRFAENYEGEVVAESRKANVDSLLGLWYPASDIPEQARRLYLVNPIRAIADSSYTPSYLFPELNPDTGRPTDLTYSSLRSVSPIHCEYMRNMGVAASMSISILRDGRLWGLVACHSFTPRILPYELRKAATFLSQVLSGEIARREVEDEAAYQTHATATHARFLEVMAGSSNPLLGLINGKPNLLSLIPCDGAAVVEGAKAHMIGSTPGFDEIISILGMLRSAYAPATFATSCLMNHFPLTESMRNAASGLIALELSRERGSYLFFFRPEVTQTVTWSGNPEKPVTASEDGFRLSPRKSFEAWKEVVRGRSLPWTKAQIKAANDLRTLISVVVFARSSAPAL